MILLSVVTVTYNDIGGLIETQTSLQKLVDRDDVQWIVVDGGSSDGTQEYIRNSADTFVCGPDSGIYDAMNKGTEVSVGEFVLYMNSGDSLLMDIDTLVDVLFENVDIGLFFFDTLVTAGSRRRLRRARDFNSIWHSIPAVHQSIVFKREELSAPAYHINYKVCGDYDLLARLKVKGLSYLVVHRILAGFEIGGTSTNNHFRLACEAISVQRKVLKLNHFLIAASFFRRYVSLILTLVLNSFKRVGGSYEI